MSNRLLTASEIVVARDKGLALAANGKIASFLFTVCEAQDAKTLKEVVEWGDGLCPHGTKAADTSDAGRRECYECWEALKRDEMPE